MARQSQDEIRQRELDSRAFWDGCAADDVMSVIRHGLRSDVWKSDLMQVHFHLAYHYAHQENDHLDFCDRHGIGRRPIVVNNAPIAADAR